MTGFRSAPRTPAASETRRGWIRLAGAGAALLLVWGGLLPWVSRWPACAARLREHERRGIDAAAMYYTELPCLAELREWLDRRGASGRPGRQPIWRAAP